MGCTVSYDRTLSPPLHTASQQSVSSAAHIQDPCSLSAQLSPVSSGAHLSAPLHVFSSSAISCLGCGQSALLHSVTFLCSSAVQLRSVSSAVFCQLSCNLSALAYSVMQFICCDRPAASHQLSHEVQAPLQSIVSTNSFRLVFGHRQVDIMTTWYADSLKQ